METAFLIAELDKVIFAEQPKGNLDPQYPHEDYVLQHREHASPVGDSSYKLTVVVFPITLKIFTLLYCITAINTKSPISFADKPMTCRCWD